MCQWYAKKFQGQKIHDDYEFSEYIIEAFWSIFTHKFYF